MWKGMDVKFKKFVAVGAIGVAVVLGATACSNKTNNSPDQIIETEKKLKNGKTITCLVLIEDNTGTTPDEWDNINCDWAGAR